MTSLILVTAWPGQPSVGELARAAAAGERPRKDYVEIARRIDAEVVDGDQLGRSTLHGATLLARHGKTELAQVWTAIRRRRELDHVIAWGDRLGLMLAMFARTTGLGSDLVMVSHFVSTPRRARFIRATRAPSRVRLMIHYSSTQLAFAQRELGVPGGRLAHLLQPVDLDFWIPGSDESEDDLICAVGTEARDYPVLLEAVRGLDARVEIAVGSMVMSPTDRGVGRLAKTMSGVSVGDGPSNVVVRHHLSPIELRELYRRARLVVVPLRDVDFDAGVTAITEAMAMGKPVIVSRTRGQVDVVTDGKEGLLVPPGDALAMRGAIVQLLQDPGAGAGLGAAGRELAERRHSLDDYVDEFAGLVLCR